MAKGLEQDPQYEIEDVLDQRRVNKRDEFLVKWRGFDESENSWEPRSSFWGGKKPDLMLAKVGLRLGREGWFR